MNEMLDKILAEAEELSDPLGNLPNVSRNRMYETFRSWDVPEDYAVSMYDYLVYGFSPGSFFSAVLENDFMRAIGHSHPANTITALKALTGWIQECMPNQAYGSSYNVAEWQKLDSAKRRKVLEAYDLIYTVQEETFKLLKNKTPEKLIQLYY
jgi:hypothetical protein